MDQSAARTARLSFPFDETCSSSQRGRNVYCGCTMRIIASRISYLQYAERRHHEESFSFNCRTGNRSVESQNSVPQCDLPRFVDGFNGQNRIEALSCLMNDVDGSLELGWYTARWSSTARRQPEVLLTNLGSIYLFRNEQLVASAPDAVESSN